MGVGNSSIYQISNLLAHDITDFELLGIVASAADAFGGDDGLGGYMPLAVSTPDPIAGAGATQLSWVHANHMGVPLRYSDASGNTLSAPSSYSVPGFPGQSQTFADLYYNRYRDYDSSTGRYIQADPIGLAGGPSAYSYAMNNPLRYIDPQGLDFGDPGWKFGDPMLTPRPMGDPGCSDLVQAGSIDLGMDELDCSCREKGSFWGGVAESAEAVGNFADMVAIGSAGLSLATAPTGAGGALFGVFAAGSGAVGRVASGVQTLAHAADGNLLAAGVSGLGIAGGRVVGDMASRHLARRRPFGDLSASQQRQAELYGNVGAAATSRLAARLFCD